MYKTFTQIKAVTIATIATTTLLLAGTALAGPPDDGKARPGKPAKTNIVDTAVSISTMLSDEQGVPEFTYLLAAVGCLDESEAGTVLGILTGKKKHTLFAPVNDAFRNLQGALGVPEEERAPEVTCAVDSILGAGTLFAVLTYHVTEKAQFTNRVFRPNGSNTLEMLSGDVIHTTSSKTIIDGVPQTITPLIANVRASNGAIHAIDTVMLPFNPFAEE